VGKRPGGFRGGQLVEARCLTGFLGESGSSIVDWLDLDPLYYSPGLEHAEIDLPPEKPTGRHENIYR
jgi:hypothetical protein